MSEHPPLASLDLVEMLDAIPEMSFIYRDDGCLVAFNTTCEQLLGVPREAVVGTFNLFANEAVVGPKLMSGYRAAFAGAAQIIEPVELKLDARLDLDLQPTMLVRWVETTLVPLALRPDGSACYVLGLQRDVTDRIEARERIEAAQREIEFQQATIDSLEAARREIELQRETIEALSTPVIEVWEDILTLPLLGRFNAERATRMSAQVLDAVTRTGARYVIFDLTGIAVLDTAIASHVLRAITALGLLGARGVLVGIQPDVAQLMVSSDIELQHVEVYQNLRQALRACLREAQ